MALAHRRVLIILMTGNHSVHNRVVMHDEPLSPDDLNSIRNYVNHHFMGWTLDKARRELLRRIEEERATYDAVLRRLTLLYQKGLLECEQTPEVHMEGALNLVAVDLHLTREKMRDLFRALEEMKRLLERTEQVALLPAREV